MSKINILLVDDDLHYRKSLSTFLMNAGFDVDACRNSSEAISKLQVRGQEYRIVLLDWALANSDESGQIMGKVREVNPYLPIVVFTGGTRESGADALQQGAARYLRKPFSERELVDTIRDVLSQEGIFRQVAESTREITATNQCLVWRYHEKTHEFKLAGWADPSTIHEKDKAVALKADRPGVRRVMRSKFSLFIRDMQNSSMVYHTRAFVKRHSWQSMVSASMRYRGELLGLLEVYVVEGGGFLAGWQETIERRVQAFADHAAESIYNAERASKNQELINSVSSLSAEQPTMDILADAILVKAKDLVDAETGIFYMRSFDKNSLFTLGHHVQPRAGFPKRMSMQEKNLATLAVADGVLQNRHARENVKPLAGSKYRSQIAIPLKRGELVVGVLALASKPAQAFSEGDLALMRSFASLAGPALDQVKLQYHLQQISQSVLKGHMVLQKAVVRAIHELLGKSVALWLWNDEMTEFIIPAAKGVSEEFMRKAHIKYDGRDDSLIAHAFLTKKPINCADMAHPPTGLTVMLDDQLKKEKWISSLIVPIFDIEKQPIGAFAIKRETVGSFTQYEEDFLSNFANQVAAAFENHRRRERLEQLARSSQVTISPSKGEKDVLGQFVRIARDLTRASCVVIYPYDSQRGTFFDVDRIAATGLLGKRETVNRKPRENGLAQIICCMSEPLVVHDVDKGWAEEIDFTNLPSEFKHLDTATLLGNFIQKSNFIVREKIKAFVGLPIWLSGMAERREGKREVGVLYINYRTPRYLSSSEINLIRLFAHQVGSAIQNARLNTNLLEQVNRLESLHRVGNRLGRITDATVIIETVVSAVLDTLECSHCTYFAVEGDQLVPVISRTDKENVKIERRFNVGVGLVGWVAKHGKLIYAPDTRNDPRFVRGNQKPKSERSLIVVPVKVDGKVIGVISADQDQINYFTESDVHLMEILARQTESAIENGELLEQMSLLQDVSAAIGAASSLRRTLELIVTGAMTLTSTASGVIHLIDGNKEEITESYAYPEGGIHLSSRFSRRMGLTWEVFHFGAEISIPDIARSKKANKDLLQAGVRAVIGVPLKFEGKTIGALFLNDTLPHDFSEKERRLLATLTNNASVAIINAKNYEQRVKDITALQEINSAIGAKKISEIHDLIAQKARELTGATYSTLWIRDEAYQILRVGSADGRDTKESVLPINENSVNGYVAIHRMPYICIDTAKDKHYHRWYKDIQSNLAVPIMFGDDLIGTLDVESIHNNAYNQDQESILLSLANQAAIAIKLAQDIEKIQNQNASFEALTEIGQQLTANIQYGEQQILSVIHRQASRIMDTGNMYIALYEPENDLVRFKLAFIDGKPVDIEKEQKWTPRSEGSGLTEWIIRNKKSVLHRTKNDTRSWYDRPETRDYLGTDFASWLGVPIMFGNEVLGVIATYNKTDENKYNQDDEKILSLMGRQAAIALQNARLISKLETMRELGEDLSRAISV